MSATAPPGWLPTGLAWLHLHFLTGGLFWLPWATTLLDVDTAKLNTCRREKFEWRRGHGYVLAVVHHDEDMPDVASIVAAVGGSLVGLAGVAATFHAGRGQRSTNLQVARLQAEYQAILAREERYQRRLEAAYRELITAVTEAELLLQRAPIGMMRGLDMGGSGAELRDVTVSAIEAVLQDDRWTYPLPETPDRHLWSDKVSALEEDFRVAAEWVADGLDTFSNARFNKMEAVKKAANGEKQWSVDLGPEGVELRRLLEDLMKAGQALRTQVRDEMLGGAATNSIVQQA